MNTGAVGGRHGAGEYNPQLTKLNRTKRIESLTMSDVNLDHDEFLMKNQNGLFECRLCCTTHKTEAAYLNHTYGKTHLRNLERRKVFQAKREAQKGGVRMAVQPKIEQQKLNLNKIGNPSYKLYKNVDVQTGNLTILFELQFPDIKKHSSPKYRIMSTYEQHIEQPDPKYQFLLFAAIPYNTVAFKIPNTPINTDYIIEEWKPIDKTYTFQLTLSHLSSS